MASSQIKKTQPPKKDAQPPLTKSNKVKKIILKPVPFYVLILVLIPFLSVGFIMYHPNKSTAAKKTELTQATTADACVKSVRERDTGLISPLLFVESCNDEGNLTSLKAKLSKYITTKQKDGSIITASVYVKTFDDSPSHTEINPNELYDPASLMKVPMLLIYLRAAKDDPKLLKTKLFFKGGDKNTYAAAIKDKTITPGKSYTIEELLYSMIAYSDNEAFWLLAAQPEGNGFEKLNNEFEIPINTDHKNRADKGENFVGNVNSMSRFFRVLYNASYLGRKNSQYALNLMTKCTYKDGLLKGIDPGIRVAHKFGERTEDGVSQLHEFGIVYLENNSPYLIGVMTKGAEAGKLPGILSDISKITFDELNGKQ